MTRNMRSTNDRLTRSFSGRIETTGLGMLETIRVPTAIHENEEAKQIDLDEMSYSEVHDLKRSDPFLYYSIPEMRRKSYTSQDSDDEGEELFQMPAGPSDASRSNQSNGTQENGSARQRRNSSRLSASMSPELLANAELGRRQFQLRGSITRQRRLSTEGHVSLMYDDFMEDMASETSSTRSLEQDRGLLQALGLGELLGHAEDGEENDSE